MSDAFGGWSSSARRGVASGHYARMRYLLTLVLLACPLPLAAQQPYVVQPGHMDLEIGPDGNTVIFDAPDGLVVIDSGRHRGHSQAVLDHAASVGKPVAALVNTHWHLDHTTGNRDILGQFPQARLVATQAVANAMDGFLARSLANARERLADPALPADARARTERGVAAMEDRTAMVPADPILADGPVDLGGRRFQLHVAPAAATEADLWLVAEDEQVAVLAILWWGRCRSSIPGARRGGRTRSTRSMRLNGPR
ncbi:MAG: MBL fold metallo-hydrolase [Alteraurantiacibacter sp.]